MTSLKTIAATTLIAVAGTVAAFTGLHLGQSPADAATAAQLAKAKTSYTVTMSAKDLTKLVGMMNGKQTKATVHAATHRKQATHRVTHRAVYRSTSRSYARSGGTYSQRGGYGCYGRRSGSSHRSGSWGCSGGCW